MDPPLRSERLGLGASPGGQIEFVGRPVWSRAPSLSRSPFVARRVAIVVVGVGGVVVVAAERPTAGKQTI